MLAAVLVCAATLAVAAVPAAVPAPSAFKITPELLERWSVPVERYRAMEAAEKARLRDDLEAGERSRLRRLELIRLIKPQGWEAYVDAKGFLTPDGQRLVEEREAALRARGLAVPVGVDIQRADGKPMGAEDFTRARAVLDGVFDGTAALGERARAGDELVFDARVRNETVRSVTVTNPKTGLSLEVGQLGIDGRSSLLMPSPYVNVTKAVDSDPKSWVDYRVKAQIAYVDLKARFFHDGPDPRVGRLADLAVSLGAPADDVARIRQSLSYDDAYRAQGIVVASLLAQMGRAYHLGGPVDVGWSVTSLTKMMHLAPNQAFDESIGLRIRLPGDELFLGVFGGVMQNISPVGNRVYQELMGEGGVKAGVNLENAPHWTTALWGRVPGVDDARFSVSVGQRYNADTTVTQGEAALMTSVRRVPIAVRASVSRESGPGIEYERDKARLQVDAQLSDRTRAYLAYERDKIQYGNADLNSDAIIAGLTVDLDGKRGANLTVDHLFGGEYETKGQVMRPYLPGATRVVTDAISDGVQAAERATDLVRLIDTGAAAAQIDAGMNALSLALGRLGPEAAGALIDRMSALPLTGEQRAVLADVMLRVAPAASEADRRLRRMISESLGPAMDRFLERARDGATRQELLADLHADAGRAVEVLRLIGDQETWNAVAISAGRRALLTALDETQTVDIPVLDKTISFKTHAPVLLAAFGAFNSRLSPLAPVRAGEAEPWLLRMAADRLDMPDGPVTPEMITARLVALGQERLQDELDRRLAPAIDRLVASGVYDRPRVVSTVFDALPASAADALRARYGADLENLLPPEGASAEQMRRFLSERLGGELSAALGAAFGEAAARAVSEMASWAGELLRREMNMATIQMMLAAEELDRLTVDRGRKAGDFGVEMIASSFRKLDARRRDRMSSGVAAVKRAAIEDFAAGDRVLAARLTALGRARLAELTLDPAWPKGFTIAVADEQWAPLLGAYGDGAFFDMARRMGEARRASGKTAPLTLRLEYDGDERGLGGASIWQEKNGGMRIVLSRPKDQGDAAFRLRNLESYLK